MADGRPSQLEGVVPARLPFALKFCSGTTLSTLRTAASMFSEVLPVALG